MAQLHHTKFVVVFTAIFLNFVKFAVRTDDISNCAPFTNKAQF